VASVPNVLVSWSHSDPGWDATRREQRLRDVHAFVDLLRGCGLDADADLYHFNEGVDWTRWGPRIAASSDFVVVVCSRGWRLAWEGTGDPTIGAGAAAETDVLKSLYAQDRDEFVRRVRLVVFPDVSRGDVPAGLDGVSRYQLPSIDTAGIEDLVRDLTGQPSRVMPPLGPVPSLPPTPPSRSPDGTSPGSTALGYRSLDDPVPMTWRTDWDRSAGTRSASITVHATRVPPVRYSDRRFLTIPALVQRVMRASRGVADSAALSIGEAADSVVVSVEAERRYEDVDYGTLLGVRVAKAGQVSVIRTLPTDRMGSVLDEALLADGLRDSLSLIAEVWDVNSADLALAVELNAVTLVTDGTAEQLGQRSRATMTGAMRSDLHLEPDELIASGDLAHDRLEIAADVVASLLRAWRLG
jgi:hypothetical protein